MFNVYIFGYIIQFSLLWFSPVLCMFYYLSDCNIFYYSLSISFKIMHFSYESFSPFPSPLPPLPTYSSKYFDNKYYVYSSLLFLSFSILSSCVINILPPEQLPLEHLLVQTLIINYSRFSFPFSLFLFLLHFHCLLIFLLDVELQIGRFSFYSEFWRLTFHCFRLMFGLVLFFC